MEEKVVSKDKLLEAVKSFKLEKEIKVPELAKHLNLPEDECIFKIKGASFEDHIRAVELQKQPYRFVREILSKIKEGYTLEQLADLEEKFLNPETSEQTIFDLTMFQRCVLEPGFSFEEVVELSKVVPELINRVTTEIVNITSVEK